MKLLVRLALALSACFLALTSFAANPAAPPVMRLGDDVKPLAYNLAVTLLPDNPGFDGRVEIDVDLSKRLDFFWLNSNGLKIRNAQLRSGSLLHKAQVVQGGDHTIGLKFASAVPAGRATVLIDYSGTFSTNETRGVFKQQERGDWYAFTQFESISARRAVPSFDEPHWKTPWSISLTVKQDHVAIANTRAIGEDMLPGGLKRVRFAVTEPLPSYLVAFAAGPFEVVDGGTAGMKSVPLRYIVPRGRSAETRFIREATPKVLSIIESYFGTPYPYDKLDSVVIPITVNFWAMENPGLITYRAPLMLARPDRENERFQQLYVAVGGHEIAHQWFGNLVTMSWWEDLWLKESFATWMARKASQQYNPQWEWHRWRERGRQEAFSTDRLASTRQVRQPVNTRDDLDNAYDRITYDKGGAVLTMFETWMGEDAFREGVRRYMAKHAHGNASAADFFAAMAGNDPEVQRAFTSFVSQPGLPVIDFEIDCAASGKPAVQMRQQRFQPLGGMSEQRWLAPVCMRYEGQSGTRPFCTLLREREQRVDLPSGGQCPAWVMPNPRGDGYYLSRLGPRARAGLGALPFDGNDAASFLAEQGLLAKSASLPALQLLQIVTPLAADPRPEVLSAVAGALDEVHPAWFDDASRVVARDWVRRHLVPRAKQLGWAPQRTDSDAVRQLRGRLLPFAAEAGEDAELRAQARALALEWLAGDRAKLGAAATGVLYVAAMNGDAALFDAFLAALKRPDTDSGAREEIYRSLGRFHDPALRQRAFEYALSDGVDLRESADILSSAGNDADNSPALLAFVAQRFDVLARRMPEESLARMPRWHRELCSREHRAQMAQLYGARMPRLSGGGRNLAQALETVDICIRTRETQAAR